MPPIPAFAGPPGGTGYTFAASVADALLYQFKEYARFAVESGEFAADASYEKVLRGLQVAAPQAGTVLDSLLRWRADALTEAVAAGDPAAVLRRRLSVEALFIEAALRLVDGDPSAVPPATAHELENLAFDWILNGERHVDSRTATATTAATVDPVRLRDRVVLGAARLLGSLSHICLDSIVDRFQRELGQRIRADAASPARAELYALCHGLRFLRLHGDTPAQLRSATNFLESMFPLKHVAPDKKSRLQQAITDALTSALAPLADSGDPGAFGAACDPALRKQWFATVNLLRTELLRWVSKQAKQAPAGLPAVAALTCLQEEPALVASIDALVEQLHRQLRDKRAASMALLCLTRCVACFLRRLRDRSNADRLTKWVAHSVGTAIQSVVKGALIAPDQLELIRQLCTAVAAYLPEYGLKGMVLELLATDGGQQPWEASMAGLMALMSVVSEAPARLAGREPAVDLPPTAAALEAAAAAVAAGPQGSSTWSPSTETCDQLLEIVRSGHHPLEAYGPAGSAAVPPVSAAVARLLVQLHQIYGYSRLTSGTRTPSLDAGPKERLSGLVVFIALLRLVPYVIPDTWAAGGMADDLPGYTIHAEPAVRAAAVAAMRRCMAALPRMRDSLLGGMAAFVAREQEEHAEVIKEGMGLILGLMRDWDRLSAVEAATAAAAGEPAPSLAVLGSFGNLARVEGAALGLLCSPNVEVRVKAVELARGARALHRALVARSGGPLGPLSSTGGGSLGLSSDSTVAGSAYGPPSTSRSSSGYHRGGADYPGSSSMHLDPPPLLTLPHHVRRSTTASIGSGQVSFSGFHGGDGGGGGGSGRIDRVSSAGPHHARHSTLGSISAFSPTSMTSVDTPSGAAAAGSALPTPADSAAGTEDVFYLADIVDHMGDAMTRACYWDFGTWSDLWREWRLVPPGVSFRDCLTRPRTADDSAGLRWARIVCEVTREAWRRCERSAFWAHTEVAGKLKTLVVLEPSGRQLLPQEGLRGGLARTYALLAAAAPIYDASHVGDRSLSSRDLIRLLVSSARAGVDYAVMALGCMDTSCHTLVAAEAAGLAEEYGGGAGGGGAGGGGPSLSQGGRAGASSRARRDEARLVHAHVLRVLCSNLPSASLTRNSTLKDKIVEFVWETNRHISLLVDISPETQQLRYCLCSVARAAATQLSEAAPQLFAPLLRKQLFDRFAFFCEDGQAPGLFWSEMRRHVAVAKAQAKGASTPDALRALESDIMDATEQLEYGACAAMAAMLAGPLFDVDAGSPGGRVITWLDRMLAPPRDAPAGLPGGGGPGAGGETTWGPPKETTARAALRNLLRSSPTELAPAYIDRAYAPLPRVAAAYFLVLTEVYAAMDLPIEPHVAVSLVLQKAVDVAPAVRDAARGLLGTLARRVWAQDGASLPRRATTVSTAGYGGGYGAEGPAASDEFDGAVVVGSLAESHQAYQQHLSASLARDHAELAHGVVVEVLSRHLAGGGGAGAAAAGGEVLLCLPPWLEYASFARGWEGQWGGTVLRLLCAVTAQAQQGLRRASPVAKLWATVASNRRNIVPTLDFMVAQGVAETAVAAAPPPAPGGAWGPAPPPTACAVGKQAALYLSRVAPRQTIDHLASEAAQQMGEPDEGSGPGRRGPAQAMAMGAMGGPLTLGGPSGGMSTPSRPVEWVRIKEFHDKSSSAPVQQPLPQQQPLAVHAAAAVAAATSASSRPLTPASIALAIKRSTLDLIVKTGAAVVDTVAVAGAAAVGISSGGLTTPGAMPRGTRAAEAEGGAAGMPPQMGLGPMGAAGAYLSTSLASTTPPPAQQRPGAAGAPASAVSAAPTATPEPAAPPPPRTALTRPEVAMCLLSEVACERDEELRPHLPALLHAAVLHADSTNALVRQEACQLLQYLLYSLACRPLEAQGGGGNGGGAGGPAALAAFGAGGVGGSGQPSADYARVAGVIGYLQSLGGEPLWAWELPSLAQPWVASAGYVAAFVQLVADCFFFDTSVRERWSAEALKWACCAASRHAASRSHQVFCALSPALTSAACTALLAALQKCLHSATAQGLDTAVEILCTLRVLLANTPPRRILAYPQLLTACIALLCSSVVRVGELAAALLIQLLGAVDLAAPAAQAALASVLPLETELGADLMGARARRGSGILQNQFQIQKGVLLWPLGHGLLAGAPDVDADEAAGGPWLALQQLLVKGLFQQETEALALDGMAAVARQVAAAGARGRLRNAGPMRDATNLAALPSDIVDKCPPGMAGIEVIVGSAEAGLAISLAAALPWLCVHVGAGELADTAAAFLNDTAAACGAVGWEQLAAVLGVLASGPPPGAPPGAGAAAWLPDLCEALAGALFPEYSRIMVQRLMETVQRAEERYQAAALAALAALFAVPGLDLGSPAWFVGDSHLVEMLSAEVGGPLGPRALEVLQALAAFRGGVGGAAGGAEPALEWRQCMDDLGESNKVCAEALRRVVEACPGSDELARAASATGLGGDLSGGAGGVGAVGGGGSAGVGAAEQLLPFLPSGMAGGGGGMGMY